MIVCALAALVLALCASWILWWNLGASSISIASDEVIYVRITQGVVHDGNIFPLTHGKAPSFEKPPLVFWLNAIAPWLVGESNLTYRASNALLGLVAFGLSVLVAARVSGALAGALAVGFLLLGVPEWIIAQHGFRRLVLDGLLTVATLGMAWFTWRVIEEERAGQRGTKALWMISAWCSVAVLTKSVAAFFPLVCVGVSLLLIVPSVVFSRRIFILAAPCIVFVGYVALLWFVGGDIAIRKFLGVEIYTRAVSGFEGHNTSNRLFYWWYLFVRGASAPKWLLTLGTIGACFGAIRDARYRFLLVWAFVPVALYSLAASKTPWYLNPFFPFLCMVAVGGVVWLCESIRLRVARPIAGIVCVGVVLWGTLPPYERALRRHMNEVVSDTDRLGVDRLVEEVRAKASQVVIVNGALSGHTNPRKGRFNVEGIYREMLRPGLVTVKEVSEIAPAAGQVVFLREEDLARLPSGWREVGRVPPYNSRTWTVVAVER